MTCPGLLAATIFVTHERAGPVTMIDSQSDKAVKMIAMGTRVRGVPLSFSVIDTGSCRVLTIKTGDGKWGNRRGGHEVS